jgi:hypothetical protein
LAENRLSAKPYAFSPAGRMYRSLLNNAYININLLKMFFDGFFLTRGHPHATARFQLSAGNLLTKMILQTFAKFHLRCFRDSALLKINFSKIS